MYHILHPHPSQTIPHDTCHQGSQDTYTVADKSGTRVGIQWTVSGEQRTECTENEAVMRIIQSMIRIDKGKEDGGCAMRGKKVRRYT